MYKYTNYLKIYIHQGFPGCASGKEFTASAGDTGDMGLIPGSGRSAGGGNGNPLQYFWSGKSYGQRSLAGYRPWSCKELDTTEHTHINASNFIHSTK